MILCYTCQFWVLFYGNCNQIMKWHKTLFKGFFFHFQANSLVFDLSMPKRQTFKNFKSCVVHHFLYPFLIFYFFSSAVCVGFKFSLQNSHQNNKESDHFFFSHKVFMVGGTSIFSFIFRENFSMFERLFPSLSGDDQTSSLKVMQFWKVYELMS